MFGQQLYREKFGLWFWYIFLTISKNCSLFVDNVGFCLTVIWIWRSKIFKIQLWKKLRILSIWLYRCSELSFIILGRSAIYNYSWQEKHFLQSSIHLLHQVKVKYIFCYMAQLITISITCNEFRMVQLIEWQILETTFTSAKFFKSYINY